MCNFAAVIIDFMYSTDFMAMNASELSHTCMHLLCTAGEGSFVFNERCYHIVKNDLVVIPMPARVSNIAAHADMQVEWFAADYSQTATRMMAKMIRSFFMGHGLRPMRCSQKHSKRRL